MAFRRSTSRRTVARRAPARRSYARRPSRGTARRSRAASVRRGSGVLKLVIEHRNAPDPVNAALASAQGVQAVGLGNAKRSKF